MPDNTDPFANLEAQAVARAIHRGPICGRYYELWNKNIAYVSQLIRDSNLQKVTIVESANLGNQQVSAAASPEVRAA